MRLDHQLFAALAGADGEQVQASSTAPAKVIMKNTRRKAPLSRKA